jgi:CheY-like chemotaxis protein
MAGELILVVDDDPDIVELLRCLLHDAGYEVETADADAVLSLAQKRRPLWAAHSLARSRRGVRHGLGHRLPLPDDLAAP